MAIALIGFVIPWMLAVAVDSPGVATQLPEIFAPGVISSPAHEAAPAFAMDGNTVYFQRSSAEQSTILVSHRSGNRWSAPEIVSFSGQWNDMEPAMAPDGKSLVFISDRPIEAGGQQIKSHYQGAEHMGGNLWRVRRTASGWGQPEHLPAVVNFSTTIFAPSVVADGSVYFMTWDEKTNHFRLQRAQFRDGAFAPPQPLPFSDGSTSDVDPAVAPDESFMVFGSGRIPKRGMDLFIVFKHNGAWGEPIWMGDVVNSPGSDAEPRLSPDLNTLYFSSERLVPIAYPRSPAQARADLARMAAWDNGNYNIWSVPLKPWLDVYAAAPVH
jgi:hypothetical protein